MLLGEYGSVRPWEIAHFREAEYSEYREMVRTLEQQKRQQPRGQQ
jgi:hypothetical protein